MGSKLAPKQFGLWRARHSDQSLDRIFRREATMRINWTVIAGVGIVLATPSHGQQNRLEQAATAMGAASLNSIQYRGSGNVYSFGQAYKPFFLFPPSTPHIYTPSLNDQAPDAAQRSG